MRRVITFWAFSSAAGLCFGLYMLGHHVERIERQLAELNRQIVQEEQSIQVLKAEWVYLNRPGRLQELAATFADRLRLAPLEPAQIVSMEGLQGRLAALAEAARIERAQMLARLPLPKANPARPKLPEQAPAPTPVPETAAVPGPMARLPAPPAAGLHLASAGRRP